MVSFMQNFEVTRWRRYGKDRLYVKDSAGRSMGWVDLQNGRRHSEDPHRADELEAAVAGRPELGSVTPALERRGVEGFDLATNRPGHAVLAQAASAREQAPVKTLLARALCVHTDERAWRVGGRGEQKVGRQLAKLGASWKVLHSIPVGAGDSDIDHLVIGPGGVYTVNAKHHPGKKLWVGGDVVMVNGQRQPYVRNARFEADRAARLLNAGLASPVAVVGLVAIVGAETLTVKTQPEDGRVQVLGRRDLVRWLERRPVTLLPGEVNAVYERARISSTWRGEH